MPFFLQHTHTCVEYIFKPLQDNHFEAVGFVLGVIVFLESKSSPSCRFLADYIRFLSQDFPSYFCLHFTLYPQKSSGHQHDATTSMLHSGNAILVSSHH